MSFLMKLTKETLSEAGAAKIAELKDKLGIEGSTRPSMVRHTVKKYGVVFDATGSMDRVWDSARTGIEKLSSRLATLLPKATMDFVAYRDYSDQKLIECRKGIKNVADAHAFVSGINCNGGDDFPEAVEEALLYAKDNNLEFVVLVGDAPPHGVVDNVIGGKDYRKICLDLKRKGTVVYTVSVTHNVNTIKSFKEIAQLTGGKFFLLDEITDLVDVISVASAKQVGGISTLRNLIKKEQGELTDKQRELLEE